MDALTDINRLNLCGLMCVRGMARKDMAAAIVCFGLSRETLQRISTMPPGGILELVEQAGEQVLFRPSAEIALLLDRALESHACARPTQALAAVTLAASNLRT